jgi:hypothetical protein
MSERPFDRADPAKILLVEDEIAIAVLLEPLVERRVPFVFMTGYDDLELPAWVPPVPRFAKPFHVPDLVALLPDLIRRSRSVPEAK